MIIKILEKMKIQDITKVKVENIKNNIIIQNLIIMRKKIQKNKQIKIIIQMIKKIILII